MSSPRPDPIGWEPRWPALVALVVFVAAGLTLCWPILTGQFLAGPHSDQFVAGYGFRLFGAEYFREYGRIPLWNPYLFSGLPFVAAMHGDIFYPTAWLRWVLPVDTAMNLGFAVHIVIAGAAMYAFLRALHVSWGGAVIGGLAYELTGLVASQVSPGHDGKLFVSALTPLLFLALLRAVRDRRVSGFGMTALTVGLALHGHPQMSYYLLVGSAVWGAYLAFVSPEKPERRQLPLVMAGAIAAVALGFGLYAIQALPFMQYIPFSPRGAGGPSGGWEYATAFAMPPDELLSWFLPEFNGIVDAYWGSNFFKLHTEYIGVVPLILASFGIGDRKHRSVVMALGVVAGLFLLVSLGGHTPFYRLWYELMPMMKKVRAPGMAFFLVAFPVAAFAGMGAERLFRGEITARRAVITAGVFGAIALLGVLGVLQGVAQALAEQQMYERALDNAAALRIGSVRLLVLAVAAALLLAGLVQRRFGPAAAIAALGTLTVADLYSVERRFFAFQPPAAVTYQDDAITTRLRATPLPYRTLDVGVYRGSWLMAHHIPTMLGYHGNELRWYDELLGGKNQWQNLGNPILWDLFAVRYLVAGEAIKAPGWHPVMGPVPTTAGVPAWLYEADALPEYARVLPAAVKVPEAQIIATVLDPRFPANRVALYPDTVNISLAAIGDSVPAPAPVQARVTAWAPGRMTVQLTGQASTTTYLVISENWYPDWAATVDGKPATTLRAHYSLLSVALPSGAREVVLEMRSAAYQRGRMISLASLGATLLLLLVPVFRRRANG